MDEVRRKSSLRSHGASPPPGPGMPPDQQPSEERPGGAGGSRDVALKIDENGNGYSPFSFNGGGGWRGAVPGNASSGANSTASTPRAAGSSRSDSPRSPAKVWREGSYEFWNNDGGGKAHVSFRDQEPQKQLSTSSSSSSDSDADDGRRRAGDDGEVARCTSNATAAGAGPLLRAKTTRSRLMDPPPQSQPAPPPAPAPVVDDDENTKSPVLRTTGKSGNLFSKLMSGHWSGQTGKSGPIDEDDDDPFSDDDVPDDLKRGKLDALTISQWVSLFLVVTALACTLGTRILSEKKPWGLPLWKWELLVFVLICGRLVSGWIIRLAVFCVERSLYLRKRVLYFVYGVRRAVQNALWLGLVLASWHLSFNRSKEAVTPVLHYVTRILLCFVVATLACLLKTLLLKVLASSFHVSTYFDRIQEALSNQYVIEALSGPPLIDENHELQLGAGATVPSELRAAAPPTKKVYAQRSIRLSGVLPKGEGSRRQLSKEEEERITIDKLRKLNQKNVSAWNMKRLMSIVRFGTLTTMDEQIQKATGEGDESATQIRSEYEAKIAAKKIFHNVAKPASKYIYLSDLKRFMGHDDAIKAMNLFEGAPEHSRISKRSLKNWVVNAFRERRALALTLNDTKTAVDKLNQMANVVVVIVVLALWFLILGIGKSFFVFIGSQLLLAVFVFGNTLKTIFEAIIFLFVIHPFDVGDRCEIEGVQVVVEEMNIMTTVFLRYDNLKIYYPNTVLATKPIMNYYRSPDMGEAIDFAIHVATPVEQLALMKERILRYIDNKKDHWYPGAKVVLRDVHDTNKLKVSIWLQHTLNFQDMGMRFVRRELVLQEMIKVLKDLDIEYRMLPLNVNVRNAPPIQSTRMPTTWSYS